MSYSRCVKMNLHQINCIQAYLDYMIFFFLTGQACVLWACVVSASARSECLHNRSFHSAGSAGARLCSGCT